MVTDESIYVCLFYKCNNILNYFAAERLKSLTGANDNDSSLHVNIFSLLYRLIFFYPHRNSRDAELNDEVKYIYVDVRKVLFLKNI